MKCDLGESQELEQIISVSMDLKIYSNINNVKSQQSNVNQTMNWCIPSYKTGAEETHFSSKFLIRV